MTQLRSSDTNAELKYSDGIAGARTMIALEGNASALQRRFPSGWVLAPYAGDDLRGTSLRGANMLVPFHEVYAVRTQDGQRAGLPQVSYIAFVSQARNEGTSELAHLHRFTYTEDPAGVPGRYGDGSLARITRSQTFSKERRGETEVRESFSALSEGGEVHLSLAYEQGGELVIWVTPDQPNLPLRAAKDPSIVRWYQKDRPKERHEQHQGTRRSLHGDLERARCRSAAKRRPGAVERERHPYPATAPRGSSGGGEP
jgi:hypothetical protein